MKYLILSLIIFFCFSCDGVSGSDPWSDLSWLDKGEVKLILKNTNHENRQILVKYFNRTTREAFDEDLTIAKGESDTITIELFRPEIVDLRYRDNYQQLYLIPGHNIEIELLDSMEYVGVNSDIYSALYRIGDHELNVDEFNNVVSEDNLPEWLLNYLKEARAYKAVHDIYKTAGYDQFIGVESDVSRSDSIKAEALLVNTGEGFYHNYFSLLQIFKSNFEFIRADVSGQDEMQRYATRKKLYDKILEIEDEQDRYNFLAMHVEGTIRKRKEFRSRDKILNFAIGQLPAVYVVKLNDIEKEYSNQDYDTNQVLKLLKRDFESLAGKQKVLEDEDGKFKLLKFWFAGCAPCKKQIPYENELLRKFDHLSITHFCYSTTYEDWKEYISKNDMQGNHFFLNEEIYDEFKAVFNLGYAPRYVLLNQENEIICWECSNPSSKEIEEVVAE